MMAVYVFLNEEYVQFKVQKVNTLAWYELNQTIV